MLFDFKDCDQAETVKEQTVLRICVPAEGAGLQEPQQEEGTVIEGVEVVGLWLHGSYRPNVRSGYELEVQDVSRNLSQSGCPQTVRPEVEGCNSGPRCTLATSYEAHTQIHTLLRKVYN